MAKKAPFSAKQFNELFDLFRYIEINGDVQYENFITLWLALKKQKILCAGSDSHGYVRLGSVFTATKEKVNTPYEFLQAFKKGDIAIGSRASIPGEIENLSLEDFVKYEFNADIPQLCADTTHGIIKYFTTDPLNWRKWLFILGAFALPYFTASYIHPEYTLPGLTVLEAMGLFGFTQGIPIVERTGDKRRAEKLFERLKSYYADMKSAPLRSEEARMERKIFDISQNMGDIINKHEDQEQAFKEAAPLKEKKEELEDRLKQVQGDVKQVYDDYDARKMPELTAELKGGRKLLYKLLIRKKKKKKRKK